MARRSSGLLAYHAIQPVPIKPWQQWAFAAALVALAVASSWNGVFSEFTYDDKLIVETNGALTQLTTFWRLFGQSYWPTVWGGDGYRPLTILAFSLEWAAGDGKPWVFHATNIALYAVVSVALFRLAQTILPFAAAWIAAALFAVHPLHVEAVGNVVGQSELFVAAYLITALNIYIRARNADELGIGRMVGIGLLYAAAMLSKEHGIVLPGLILAAELVVVVDNPPIRERLIRLRPFVLVLIAMASAYLLAHGHVSDERVTGFHQYVPFSSTNLDSVGRAWTMFGVVPQWIRLFLFPARLVAEYGPPEFPVVTGFHLYQAPGILILASLIALIFMARRKVPALSFGIAFAMIALLPTSNFIVPTGILLSERTLFLPSAGAMIAVACLVPWLYQRARIAPLRIAAAAALAIVLFAGARRSVQRTAVWKNNDALFDTSVIDAPGVYRTHFMLGAWKFHLKRKREAEREYQLAMGLYDKDPYVYYSLGQEYLNARMYRAAAPLFRKVLEIDTNIVEARARLAMVLAELDQWPEAKEQAIRTLGHPEMKSFHVMRTVLRMAVAEERKAKTGQTLGAESGKAPPVLQDALSKVAPAGATKTQPPD